MHTQQIGSRTFTCDESGLVQEVKPLQHTETPWRVETDPEVPGLHCIWTDEEGVDQMSVLVARTCFAPASEANAAFIITACNLFDELRKALDELTDERKYDAASVSIARAILARAKQPEAAR